METPSPAGATGPLPEHSPGATANLPTSMEELTAFIYNLINQQVGPTVAQEVAQREAHRLAQEHTRAVKLPKPEVFRGGKQMKDAEEWLFVMDTYLNASSLTLDIERITVASGYLRGAALTWWRQANREGNPNRPTTWLAFCNGLISTFRPLNPSEIARDLLARLKQTTSVRQYASAMRDAALEIPGISDDELKDRFIRGLKPATQGEVRLREPGSFEQAVKIADRYDALRYSFKRPNVIPGPPFHNGSSNGPSAMELGAALDASPSSHTPRHQQRPKLTFQLRQQLIKEGKCFFCRQPGHMAMNCPERKKLA